ncbi:MAG TPA: acetyl-CoA carboxylase biotin carboxyl carrier protein subunit [Paludibacteraceae bacterium]|nr:acetyl-CoA carboxylase biotin carboxyl carrier protein subunit [Paludibacteraceae bacterium]HOU68240.1 acetyl-CoA carboxylase biotin carboxyl carrier protein subunit [Paludibacteraceae bacterium]HQF50093.1 acetyl-CoA carboxylase biotin carboxyl carrier protein subunit [Paludibacteraceae bacterium]HQJ89926.1 acetyl-CoA carboxylase biotin carboxyl carrier protein subunit [Paludibacteraceae bacterium]
MEVRIGNEMAEVELLSKEDNKVSISINGTVYDVDIVMAENGLCSIITKDGKSYNAEIRRPDKGNEYTVNVLFDSYQVEMIDLQTKYLRNRKNSDGGMAQDRIFSPMPGKIVKILVEKGEKVEAGKPVIIVEAMKMQSEYKVKNDCIIKDILVSEGTTIRGDETLISLEPLA